MAEIFGRYELLRRLAAGGMGEVFLARSLDAPGPKVVLKRVLPQLFGDAAAEGQFLEEARIAALLNHPHVLKVVELGAVSGRWFIAMEYVDGSDLRAWRGREVPLGVALRVGADAAAALHHAHQARDAEGRPLKVVHCDVSPHNLLVGRDGKLRLIDFGTARARTRGAAGPQGATGQGKYAYLSPEQALGEEFDHRSDQFSLGVVLWELLTGGRLFEGEDDVQTLRRLEACVVPSAEAVRPEVPRAVAQVVSRMLARDPSARYVDCDAVLTALESALAALPGRVTHAEVAAWVAQVAPPQADVVEEPAAPRPTAPQPGAWESAQRLFGERAARLDEALKGALGARLREAPRALEFLAGVADRLRPEDYALAVDLPSSLAVVWSALTEPERDAVSQLSAFTAPCTVEEAEAAVVLAAGGLPVLDVLESLVRARLVSQRGHTAAGSPRFAIEDELKAFVVALPPRAPRVRGR